MDRFPVLRGISVLLKILAVLVLVVGLLFGSVVGNQFGEMTTLGAFIIAAIYAVGLWASAELINVLLAIEANTRQSSTAQNATAMLAATPVPGSTSSGAERPVGME